MTYPRATHSRLLPTPCSHVAFEQFINKVNIRSTAGEEQVRLLLALNERACHTSQSLLNPVPVIMEVQLNGSLIK
ncbi:MAG: hypothetical protein MUO64_12885 [Anaerolineales bacterium]|nr:hypothetical protein [Anaerolineales bacterium]